MKRPDRPILGSWLTVLALSVTLSANAQAPYHEREAADPPPAAQDSGVTEDESRDDAPLLSDLYDLDTTPQIRATTRYVFPEHESFSDMVVHPDGKRVYGIVQFTAIDVWSFMILGWPEYVLIICTLVLLTYVIRKWRRPQAKGAEYCRKCNYELTKLTSDVCPECGRALTTKTRRRGKRRMPRIAVALLILAGLGTTYGMTLQRLPRDVWPESWPKWWSPWLDKVAVANLKYPWIEERSEIVWRVVEIDMVRGVRSRVFNEVLDTVGFGDITQQLAVSRNGDFLIYGNIETDSLTFYDLASNTLATSIQIPTLALPPGLAHEINLAKEFRLTDDQIILFDEASATAVLASEYANRDRHILAFDCSSHQVLWSSSLLRSGLWTSARLFGFQMSQGRDRCITFGTYPDPLSVDFIEWELLPGALNPMPIKRTQIVRHVHKPADFEFLPFRPHRIAYVGDIAQLAIAMPGEIQFWTPGTQEPRTVLRIDREWNFVDGFSEDLGWAVISLVLQDEPRYESHAIVAPLNGSSGAIGPAVLPGDEIPNGFERIEFSRDNRAMIALTIDELHQNVSGSIVNHDYTLLRYDLSSLHP